MNPYSDYEIVRANTSPVTVYLRVHGADRDGADRVEWMGEYDTADEAREAAQRLADQHGGRVKTHSHWETDHERRWHQYQQVHQIEVRVGRRIAGTARQYMSAVGAGVHRTVDLPPPMDQELKRMAQELGTTPDAIVRDALENHLVQLQRQRWTARQDPAHQERRAAYGIG